MLQLNRDSVLEETVMHLQRMVQIDTTNPPGSELQLAKYLADVLAAEKIEHQILEPSVGRATLVARLPGTGDERPLLLTAHMDVVGVERGEWSVDPFAGEIRDGFIYGRGVIDDKGMLAAELMTLLLLKRHVIDQGSLLRRDVILAATADEEAGGTWGLEWMIRAHPELIRAEYALNEGGRIRVVNGKPLYAAIQCAEKVSNVVTVRATGPSGHASIPLEGNAVARLARAVARIAEHREPERLLPITREFFSRLEQIWPEPERAKAALQAPMFDALRRTGISPTMLAAGVRNNVIPAHGDATLSIRTLPGERIDDVVARLRERVDDSQVEIVVSQRGVDAPMSDFHCPMYAAIAEAIAAVDPGITCVPYLSTGATESAYLRAWGVQTFGLLPFPMVEGDESRMHGHDERLSLDSLLFGVRTVLGVAMRISGLGPGR